MRHSSAFVFVVGVIVSGLIGYGASRLAKPAEVHVHPVAVIRAAVIPAPAGPEATDEAVAADTKADAGKPVNAPAAAVSRAEKRAIDNTWPGLTQLEINHLQMILQDAEHGWVNIFCENDAYCGDLQMDFENAFETAHWQTELTKPLMDDTKGLATSSPAIKEAIEKATHGRLKVTMIPKTEARFALVIGKKPKG